MALIPRLMPQWSIRKMILTSSWLTTPPSGCLSLCRGRSSVASPLMRSVLFLKNSPECLQRFSKAKADAYVMDLEDGVPKEKKHSALKLYAETLKSGLFRGQTVYVRLSDIKDDYKLQSEVDALCHPDLTGFIIPKITSSDDVRKADEILSEVEKRNNLPPSHCKIVPIIEDLEGFFHAPAIAKASPRMAGLFCGNADFSASFHRPPGSPIAYALELRVLLAAREAEIPAMNAVSYLDNFPRLERDIKRMKALGFDGIAVLHPSLVPFVNQLYTPTRQEKEWAEQVTAGVRIYQRSAQEYRQFIGPPHLPSASHILETHRKIQALEASRHHSEKYTFGKPEEDSGTVTPLQRKGGLTANSIKEGEWIPGILPVTLDSSWRAAWNSSFLNARRLNSDDVTAREMGLPGIQPPFHLLATLALSLAVSKSSETARFHLGIYNAVQLRPVAEGDTVRAYFSLDSVKEAGNSGKYAIVTSSHILVNQRDQAVFRVTKKTMYPRVMKGESDFAKKPKNKIPTDSEVRSHIIQNATARGNHETTRSLSLAPNELYVHRVVKSFSPGESMGFSNLIRVTNAHHINKMKYSYDDIVVPGPLVVAAAVHNVFDDFGDILYEEVVEASNVNRVNQEDMIGAVSLIHSVQPLTENSDLEEVTVRTLGIKNMDVDELLEREVLVKLFSGTNVRASDYEKICREEFPLLYRRIAAQVLWKFLRLRPLATSEAPTGIQPELT
ncbi:CLYBL [Branchiostoma lanceolatum]|uniref:CLYBL protein n=1 Tax=Branchiostoma lanceolatum TaxID=7740 RepID=A0A8K0A0S5_BRALA|nr:CLYBL [Branchiostoma lanceolatum]